MRLVGRHVAGEPSIDLCLLQQYRHPIMVGHIHFVGSVAISVQDKTTSPDRGLRQRSQRPARARIGRRCASTNIRGCFREPTSSEAHRRAQKIVNPLPSVMLGETAEHGLSTQKALSDGRELHVSKAHEFAADLCARRPANNMLRLNVLPRLHQSPPRRQ